MHRLQAGKPQLSRDYGTGELMLTFRILPKSQSAAKAMLADMRQSEKAAYAVEVKQWRERRSLDANAYCWVLLGKLGERLRQKPEEIYREMIREVAGNAETVCVKTEAADKLCAGWERNGLGWLTQTFPSKIAGCTNVILYYGSSSYDTAQMGRLIDLIVEECRAQGIETRTPQELQNLLSLWETEYEKHTAK